jgi:hypothetical protein
LVLHSRLVAQICRDLNYAFIGEKNPPSTAIKGTRLAVKKPGSNCKTKRQKENMQAVELRTPPNCWHAYPPEYFA